MTISEATIWVSACLVLCLGAIALAERPRQEDQLKAYCRQALKHVSQDPLYAWTCTPAGNVRFGRVKGDVSPMVK